MRRVPDAHGKALALSRRHGMFQPGDRVLVGLGGGVASLGLLGFLVSAQDVLQLREIAAASIESDTDDASDAAESVAEVGRMVRQLGLTFYGSRPAVPPGRRVHVVDELKALARSEGFHRVALGHTLDDDAVMVLGQIAAGRGLAGVTGLVPRRRDGVVRPLLGLCDAEACSLAQGVAPQMPPDEDARARSLHRAIRATVMPRFRALVPGLDVALAALGRDARRVRFIARAEARRRVDTGRRPDGSVDLALVPSGGLLARQVAVEGLRAVSPGALRRRDVACLARLLSQGTATTGSTLLGGVVATWRRDKPVVSLRGPGVSRAVRLPAPEGPGG